MINLNYIYIFAFQIMKITIKNPDYLGVISGGLCIFHCIATPLLFISNAELAGHGTPIEWQLLNFGFVGLSFLAIRNSAKNSSNSTVKVLFYILWAILFGLILNESIHVFHLPELATYTSAFSLCCLHVYNLKYCQCDDENCCVNDE